MKREERREEKRRKEKRRREEVLAEGMVADLAVKSNRELGFDSGEGA